MLPGYWLMTAESEIVKLVPDDAQAEELFTRLADVHYDIMLACGKKAPSKESMLNDALRIYRDDRAEFKRRQSEPAPVEAETPLAGNFDFCACSLEITTEFEKCPDCGKPWFPF